MNSDELLTRAVEKVIPEDLAEKKLKSGKPIRIYLGIDPTGSKLHIGHTVPLRKLQAFAEAGHEVIFLVGSFTAMIGDPSGRDEMRKALTKKDVENNFKTYKEQASRVLDFKKIKIVYNHEWLEKVSLQEMLKITSFFTKQQIEQRDMFVKREEEGKPIYTNELMYPLLQGYDSAHMDVDAELGATDQEFNMLAGRTIHKALGKREKFVLTVKILLGTDGRKMSKTYDNCIYIEDEPNDMFGKVMSVNDELMGDYFECCTDVPMDEVKKIIKGDPREAKVRLAKEIVTLYHGEKSAESASEAFDKVFKDKKVPDNMPEAKAKKGTKVIDVITQNKLVSSKSEARRVIEQGGVKINDKPVISIDDKAEEGVLRVGKRKFIRIIY